VKMMVDPDSAADAVYPSATYQVRKSPAPAAADHRGDDAALTISSGTRAAPHNAGIRVRHDRVPGSARFAIGHAARAAMAKAGGPTGYILMLGGEERDVRSRSLSARL
jgi:hypothetical protein